MRWLALLLLLTGTGFAAEPKTHITGAMTLPTGANPLNITLAIKQDTAVEINETILIELSSLTNAVAGVLFDGGGARDMVARLLSRDPRDEAAKN